MASKGKITDIVDVAACQKQLTTLNDGLAVVLKSVEQIAANAVTMSKAFQDSKGIKDLTENTKKLNAAESEQIIITEKAKQAKIATEKAQLQLTAAEQNAANKIKKQTDAYAELTQKLKIAAREAQNVGIAHGQNSKEFKEAAAKAKALQIEVNDLNKAMGRHQGNVGNYRDVWTGVTKVFGMVTAAFAAGGLAMEVFNGVMASTDSLMDSFEANIAGAKEATNLFFQRVATGDFTNLIQGLKDAFEEGKRYANVLDEIGDRQRALGVTREDIEGQILDQRIIAKNRRLDIKDRQASIDEIIRLEKLKMEETKEVTGMALDNELTNAAARSEMSKEEIADFVKNYKDYTAVIAEGVKVQEQIDKVRQKATTTTVTGMGISVTSVDQAAIDNYINSLSEGEKESLKFAKAQNLIDETLRTKIAETLTADIAATNEMKSAEEGLARLKNSLYNELIKEETEKATAYTKTADEHGKALEKMQADERSFIEESIDVTKRYADAFIKPEIKKGTPEEDPLMAQIMGHIDLLEYEQEKKQELADREVEIAEAKRDKLIEIGQQTYDSIMSLVNVQYENQLAQIDQLSKADETAKQRELKAAGDNAALKDSIEAKYLAKEKEREKQKIEIKQKQDKAIKAAAMVKVIIDTAIAIGKTIATWGMPAAVPFIEMDAALGAIQLATIAATPLPKYFKGRDGGPAEFAWVGERGTEAIQLASGETFLTPAKPTITFLPEHAQVITNEKLLEAAGRASIQNSFGVPGQVAQPANDMQIDRLIEAIRNKKEYHINLTERGLQMAAKRGASMTEYLNQNVRI